MSKTTHSKRIDTIKIKRMLDDSPDTSWLGEFSDTPEAYAIVARGEHEGTFTDSLPCEDCGKLEAEHTDCDDGLGDTPRGDYEYDCVIEDHCHEYNEPSIERGREFRYFNSGSVETFKASPEATEILTNSQSVKAVTRTREELEQARKDHDVDMRKNAEQAYKRMRELDRGDFCFIGLRAESEIIINGLTQTITSGGLWGIESDSDQSYFDEVEQEEINQLREQLHGLGFSKRAISAALRSLEHVDAF